MQTPLKRPETLSRTFTSWAILGPFPTGMREQDFGADPLEPYGGIHNISFSTFARYPSELVDGGSVGWQLLETQGNTVGPLEFPSTRWSWNQLTAGWSINQYQAWAVTTFTLDEASAFRVQFYSIGDFYVDDIKYSGDWYNYQTTAHVVRLSAGEHTIRVRVVNEIRVFGGSVPPKSTFQYLWEHIPTDILAVAIEQQLNFPDIANRHFLGNLCSVGVQNVLEHQAIQVKAISIIHKDSDVVINATLKPQSDVNFIMPGQIRQIGFYIHVTTPIPVNNPTLLGVIVTITVDEEEHQLDRVVFPIVHKNVEDDAFRITFEDPDGSVQYAMVKAPKVLSFEPSEPLPILVALHGAGVTASWPWWTNALSRSEKAWTVYPTGRTSWGYDWHGASMINVFQAVDELVWQVPKILSQKGQVITGDPSKLIYIGHSNGGQGAWYLGTHFPDRAVGIFAAAGYTKIQDYVSYGNWLSVSHSDPWLRGILESSIAEYNNDLHASNLAGIPIHALIGGEDENVPPLHTRKYGRLANEYASNPEFVKISEYAGQGHWWDDVLDNQEFSEFITERVDDPRTMIDELDSFTITVINPSGTGSKGGITVEQLLVPYHLGRIVVRVERSGQRNTTTLRLETTNIKRFKIADELFSRLHDVTINVNHDDVWRDSFGRTGQDVVMEEMSGEWKVVQKSTTDSERNVHTYGPLHRIYETKGPLTILVPPGSNLFYHTALQIAHDWNLFGNGDAMILRDAEFEELPSSNLIFLGGPDDNNLTSKFLSSSISDIEVSSEQIKVGGHHYKSAGTGIIFHQPWRQRHMAIVIAGLDESGFSTAAQLIPKRTGIIVSDWVVTGPKMKWQGIGGVIAAGYFHNQWKAFGYF
ncbi:hypothetical protein BGW37DRAFT_520457 [Umbelopsis sp. PMI_123]|nr:hypothetical protein BGW37DRAFT_520457 [Umbelopsis sp. PMI_123]